MVSRKSKITRKPSQPPPEAVDALLDDLGSDPEVVSPAPPQKRGRGRPATGKRSDPGWIGRTYYVREDTDIDVELELALLRREGISLDKSDLVDGLLDAWLKYRQGENASGLLGAISPRRKGDVRD